MKIQLSNKMLMFLSVLSNTLITTLITGMVVCLALFIRDQRTSRITFTEEEYHHIMKLSMEKQVTIQSMLLSSEKRLSEGKQDTLSYRWYKMSLEGIRDADLMLQKAISDRYIISKKDK